MQAILKQQGELQYIDIDTELVEAKIALQGAHLFHYRLKGKPEVLWLSETSQFAKGKAIRGGIPICWPWFANPSQELLDESPADTLAAHGIARTRDWELREYEENDGAARVVLRLSSNSETLAIWPYCFELTLSMRFGETLCIEMTTTNTGNTSFCYEEALHSYFAISNLENISIMGLEQLSYFDKLTEQSGISEQVLNVNDAIDNVYQNISQPLLLIDDKRKLLLSHAGANSAIVWNPGAKTADKMKDLSDHRQMFCVEVGNVGEKKVCLQSGESHLIKLKVDS